MFTDILMQVKSIIDHPTIYYKLASYTYEVNINRCADTVNMQISLKVSSLFKNESSKGFTTIK
jgi:hypothetical protein